MKEFIEKGKCNTQFTNEPNFSPATEFLNPIIHESIEVHDAVTIQPGEIILSTTLDKEGTLI